MSENSANNNVRDDEINLLDLFRRIVKTINRWLSAIGKGLIISCVFLIKKWLPLGLSILAGIGVSVILKSTSDSFYTSDLVFRNNIKLNSDMISYLNRLHNYCMEYNTQALQNAISSSPQQVKNIMDISAYWVIDKGNDGYPDFVDYKNNHDIYDTINLRMLDRINIRVKIKTPQELTDLKYGLIKYIESDSIFQQRNRVRLRQNAEMLLRFDYDINQLDSLQKIKYFEETKSRLPQSGGQMIFLQEQKTQLIYPDIYNLYTSKQILEVERDLYKGIVTVLSDFQLPSRRENSTAYYAKKIIPLFFFLTVFLLIIMANTKKLKELYKKY